MLSSIPEPCVVIADSLPPTRERLTAAFRELGWSVTPAVSEDDLRRALSHKKPHLMVVSSDLGQGQGVRALRSILAEPDTADCPGVLLIEGEGMPRELRNRPLPESIQPLSRPRGRDSFMDSVLKTAELALSSAPPPRPESRKPSGAETVSEPLRALDNAYVVFDRVLEIVERNELPGPVAPGVLGEIMTLLVDPDVAFKDIAACLRKHQTLAARLLEIANSARYSRGTRFTTVDAALSQLGLRVVSTQLQAFAAQQYVVGRDSKLRTMISHSLATAYAVSLACDDIVRLTKATRALNAPLVGLFHNIGQTFFLYALALLEEKGELKDYAHSAVSVMIANRMGEMNAVVGRLLSLPEDVGALFSGTGPPRSQTVEVVHKAMWVIQRALDPAAPPKLQLDAAGELLGLTPELVEALNPNVPVIRSLVASYG